jgi:SNF2 family DNA or RNA helicase
LSEPGLPSFGKYHGRIELTKSGWWVLQALPHVLVRAKRVFRQVQQNREGLVAVSDTPENCRDLAWLSQRYQLKIRDQEYLFRRSEEHEENLALYRSILSRRRKPRKFTMALEPREYQRRAATLALASRGLLIADDLGLGKTATSLCTIVDTENLPALVVCPQHLQRQWVRECGKFLPQLKCHILRSSSVYDYTLQRKKRVHVDVLICTYTKLHGWADHLADVVRTVIFEEVHEVRKGFNTRKGAACLRVSMSARLRLGLTATPIYNWAGEVFYLCELLRPGALGTRDEFMREWCHNPTDQDGVVKDPVALGTHLRDIGLCIRRTRKEVGRELPELVKSLHYVDSNPQALERIQNEAAALAHLILARADGELSADERNEAFTAGGRLDALVRQATGIAKAPYVAQFVRMLLEAGEKVLLFGWHREVYSIWLNLLQDFKPVLYTGSESESQKARAADAFVKGETNLLIMSLRSGTGLDGLQYSGCRTIVHGELDWSPAVHEQNTARVHRDGQNEACVSYFPLAETGSDPVIADVLGLKRAQLDGVRDPFGRTAKERVDPTGDRIRRLAREWLRRQEEGFLDDDPNDELRQPSSESAPAPDRANGKAESPPECRQTNTL